MIGYICLVAYIATIFAANWAIATYGVVPVGFGLVAPAGVFFAGLAFGWALTWREKVLRRLGNPVQYSLDLR